LEKEEKDKIAQLEKARQDTKEQTVVPPEYQVLKVKNDAIKQEVEHLKVLYIA